MGAILSEGNLSCATFVMVDLCGANDDPTMQDQDASMRPVTETDEELMKQKSLET